jgi:hypothetical protein
LTQDAQNRRRRALLIFDVAQWLPANTQYVASASFTVTFTEARGRTR